MSDKLQFVVLLRKLIVKKVSDKLKLVGHHPPAQKATHPASRFRGCNQTG